MSRFSGTGRRLDEDDEDTSSDDELEVPENPRGAGRPIPARRVEAETEGGAAGRAGGRGGAGGANLAKLPIQIRTMDGKTYKIEAKTDWDVDRLKQEFEKWHGGNAAMCSLFYKAKKLQENNTLTSYKIGAGDVIMANFRSTGGLPRFLWRML